MTDVIYHGDVVVIVKQPNDLPLCYAKAGIDHDSIIQELAERIEKFAMFRAEFEKICLNRVRLFTTSYNDEAERPVPVFLDPIANPVSPETLKRWSEQVSKSTDDTTTKRIAS